MKTFYLFVLLLFGCVLCNGCLCSKDQDDDLWFRNACIRFRDEQACFGELGTYHIVDTRTSDFVISKSDIAVPLLVKALSTEVDYYAIAHIAHCLSRLKSPNGLKAASIQYKKLCNNSNTMTLEQSIAKSELRLYLLDIADEVSVALGKASVRSP